MTAVSSWRRLLPWAHTLGSRLFLIFFIGLTTAYALSFCALFLERYITAKTMMLGNLKTDVATSIAILDQLPANQRQDWIPRLNRKTYQYVLSPGLVGSPETGSPGTEIAATLQEAVGRRSTVHVESIPGDDKRLQAHLRLSDGAPLTIDIHPSLMPIAEWLPYVLTAQLLLLSLCSWFAVRLAIRPLVHLADAANALDPNKAAPRLQETGPTEVVYAANAFNSMRDRIDHYLKERVQILAAISHDLQTPITRMKLRVEMADEIPEREKLLQDLTEIERLVHEGIAYARSAHGNTEAPSRIDIGSFIESLVFDYQDTGKAVTLSSKINATMVTRPHALRRTLTNLIDNALKFGSSAEVRVEKTNSEAITISVLDRGPGIPEDQLETVLQPFFRLDQSRNRDTGGAGLGLAIAHQLSLAISGTLTLRNRDDGGLVAEITTLLKDAAIPY
ncbi:ATP-binding protein [Granulicella mallensis]|uniref:histidine kinase n=1 Tax=Granulicella mallensis (strain ATCC BAA-1857 / DSM 23137 / MP5ACTX8) TaxID=682795 RepID=G8P1N3_GRAMM|nr:ATP-binding protein [Granulicella mallensis]AEU35858.1 integral membrane sensor signal transduction histidine kinase [Granulicella mallensis MP5ACTX8]